MSPQKCGVRTETKIESCSGRHGKGRFWSIRSFYWTKLVCVPENCCKSTGSYCKIIKLLRTSRWCSIRPYTGKNWRTVQVYSFFKPFRNVFYDTNGQNHGMHWRCHGVSWTKLVWSSISWIDMGKTIRRSFIGTWMEGSVELGDVCSFIENMGCFCQSTWMTSTLLERKRIWLLCRKRWWKMRTLADLHHFLTMYAWDVLSVNANWMKQLLNSIRRGLNHESMLEKQKNYKDGKNLT